jgi:hypothetical protein
MTFLYPLDYMTSEGKNKGVKVIVHKPVSIANDEESIKKAMKSVQETVTAPILSYLKEAGKSSNVTTTAETKKSK